MSEQCGSCFRPDAWNAGNVVDLVAGQGQKVGDLMRLNPEACLNPRSVELATAREIPPVVARLFQQLREILVAGDDADGMASSSPVAGQRCNQVVGFELRV